MFFIENYLDCAANMIKNLCQLKPLSNSPITFNKEVLFILNKRLIYHQQGTVV